MILHRPTLLLDKEKCLENIRQMARRTAGSRLRAHCKTHQSVEVGRWFRDSGIDCITVSSVSMALYFIHDGWQDITVAIPHNIHETGILNEIPEKVSLNLVVSSPQVAQHLSSAATRPYGIYLKIDTGMRRCGLAPNQTREMLEICTNLKKNDRLWIRGLLSHFGHTYHTKGKDEVGIIFSEGVKQLREVRNMISVLFNVPEISVGDTPSCSLLDDFHGVDELRPGNFVFYDIQQAGIGSCNYDQIAVALACPVIEVNRSRQEAIIYGGAVHLSKDSMRTEDGNTAFGQVVLPEGRHWTEPLPGCYVKGLSQEHGKIHVPDQYSKYFAPGNWIAVLPVHSCLTADAMRYYITTSGQSVSMMPKEVVM